MMWVFRSRKLIFSPSQGSVSRKLATFATVLTLSFDAFSDIVELVVLQTTDIHAHFTYDDATEGHGDWLRLATLIKKERRLAGGRDRCLLIDCGDTIQGTLIGALSKGDVSVVMLDVLKYDAWILGNHELDYGIPRLTALINRCKTPIINGNLTLSNSFILPAYRVYEKSGAKIVVIGMNAFLLDYWVWGKKMEGFEIAKATTIVEKVLPDVMKLMPDMIILALHQGLMEQDQRNANEVKSLAFRFPQIDLILGGHTHRNFPGERIGNTWYVQGGRHGEFLAKVIATIDTDNHNVLEITSQLLPSSSYSRDSASTKVTRNWLTEARSFASKRVCHVDKDITSSGTPGYDCHMSEIICRAISWATKVPIVFHGVLSKSSWAKGSYLTEAALFDVIPYENGIGMATLTLQEIKEIIEEQLKFKGKRSFNGIYGIVAEVDSATRSVVGIHIPQDPPLQLGARVPVAFNSYAIAGGGGRFPLLRRILRRRFSRLVDLDINSRDILRQYLVSSGQWKDPPFSWFRFRDSKK